MSKGDQITDLITELEVWCENEEIVTYGLSFNVAPFNFHTPAFRQ
jgi:hypothetical protein